jgi:hypothetical protein
LKGRGIQWFFEMGGWGCREGEAQPTILPRERSRLRARARLRVNSNGETLIRFAALTYVGTIPYRLKIVSVVIDCAYG